MESVSVLGQEYKVFYLTRGEDPAISEYADGYCNYVEKKIVIRRPDKEERELLTAKELQELRTKTFRHELIHAFLRESGLCEESSWACNEEMVDWFAIQLPKIAKIVGSTPLQFRFDDWKDSLDDLSTSAVSTGCHLTQLDKQIVAYVKSEDK